MARTLREAISVPSWDEWESIPCATLVIRAGNGMAEPGIAAEMTERLTATRPVEIADADHDAHLDRPDEWREALSGFLDSLHGQA